MSHELHAPQRGHRHRCRLRDGGARVVRIGESWRVRRHFMTEARHRCPLWWNRYLNPPGGPGDPRERFLVTVAGVREVLSQRGGDEDRALEVLDHLLAVWPAGILSFNAWYVLHEAQGNGMLDSRFMPV